MPLEAQSITSRVFLSFCHFEHYFQGIGDIAQKNGFQYHI